MVNFGGALRNVAKSSTRSLTGLTDNVSGLTKRMGSLNTNVTRKLGGGGFTPNLKGGKSGPSLTNRQGKNMKTPDSTGYHRADVKVDYGKGGPPRQGAPSNKAGGGGADLPMYEQSTPSKGKSDGPGYEPPSYDKYSRPDKPPAYESGTGQNGKVTQTDKVPDGQQKLADNNIRMGDGGGAPPAYSEPGVKPLKDTEAVTPPSYSNATSGPGGFNVGDAGSLIGNGKGKMKKNDGFGPGAGNKRPSSTQTGMTVDTKPSNAGTGKSKRRKKGASKNRVGEAAAGGMGGMMLYDMVSDTGLNPFGGGDSGDEEMVDADNSGGGGNNGDVVINNNQSNYNNPGAQMSAPPIQGHGGGDESHINALDINRKRYAVGY